jgi:hypothetical protein
MRHPIEKTLALFGFLLTLLATLAPMESRCLTGLSCRCHYDGDFADGWSGEWIVVFWFCFVVSSFWAYLFVLAFEEVEKIDEMGIFFACIFCGFLTYSIYILRHVVS